jgi:hypothetical protein
MSRISSLLGQPERLIKRTITNLEDKNGYPSHDARHLAENIQAVRLKLKELGLDPDDTTVQELYHALLVKFDKDCLAFDIENNFHAVDFGQKADKAAELIKSSLDLPQRWVLKTTAAKNLLRLHPPKKLMKQLSYRSVDSMLKRENIAMLYIAANRVESAAWQKGLHQIISKQDTSVFELRRVAVCRLEADGDRSAPLVYNDDIGGLAIIQGKTTENMRLLGLSVLLADFMSSLSNAEDSQSVRESAVLKWWRDMDGLIFGLNQNCVSLNIKDASLNHAQQKDFSERISAAGQAHFWKNLINRYENQLAAEEDTLSDLSARVAAARIPFRQPAFEYAEEFDG